MSLCYSAEDNLFIFLANYSLGLLFTMNHAVVELKRHTSSENNFIEYLIEKVQWIYIYVQDFS